ncbi:MAG: OadG family protein [Fusobacterium sp. JB021]|nr:OadG family protein [Fusobacterium sp. JB020]MDP0492962.1 OadG family protein [Fusobacterium sp. JB021]MDP0506362.1 OadG family protein [Fusobacterium sp. JB019]
MFEGNVMTFMESLVISGLGVSIVFSALVTLALSIVVFSKIFGKFSGQEESKKPVVQPKKENNDDVYAVIMAAVSEEVRSLKGEYKIKEIKEVK